MPSSRCCTLLLAYVCPAVQDTLHIFWDNSKDTRRQSPNILDKNPTGSTKVAAKADNTDPQKNIQSPK